MQQLPDTAMYREAVSKLRKLLYDPSSNSRRYNGLGDSGGRQWRGSFRTSDGRASDLEWNASSTRFHHVMTVEEEKDRLDSSHHGRWGDPGSQPPSGFNSHRGWKPARTQQGYQRKNGGDTDDQEAGSQWLKDRGRGERGPGEPPTEEEKGEGGGGGGGRGGGGGGGGERIKGVEREELSDDVFTTSALVTRQGISFGLLELVRRQDDLITQLEKENTFLRGEVLSITSSVQAITKENEELREMIADALKESRETKPPGNPDPATTPPVNQGQEEKKEEEEEEDEGKNEVSTTADGTDKTKVTRVKELKKDKEKLETALKKQEERLEDLKEKEEAALEKLRTALNLAETTQRYSEKVREGAEKARAELASELQNTQDELQELRNQLKAAQEESDRRQEAHDKIVEQRDARARRLEEEREELNGHIDGLNQKIRDKQNKLRNLEEDVREAVRKHLRLEEDLKIQRQHEKDVEDRYNHMIKMRDDEVRNQEARVGTLEALLKTARQDNAKLLATVTTLAQGRDDSGDRKDNAHVNDASTALSDALTALQATHEAEVASFRKAADNQRAAMESLRQEIATLRDRSTQEAEKHRACLEKVEGGVYSLKEKLEDATSSAKRNLTPLSEEEDGEKEEEEEEEEEEEGEEEEREGGGDGDDIEKDQMGDPESSEREGGEDKKEDWNDNKKDTQGGGGKEDENKEGKEVDEVRPPGPESTSSPPPPSPKTRGHDLPTDESGIEADLSERAATTIDDNEDGDGDGDDNEDDNDDDGDGGDDNEDDNDDDGESVNKPSDKSDPVTTGDEEAREAQGKGDDAPAGSCEGCGRWSILVSVLGQELDAIQGDLDKQTVRINRTMGRVSSECPNCLKHVVLWMAASLRLNRVERTAEIMRNRVDMLMHRLQMENAVRGHPLLLATTPSA
ncbi:uncharacterized protein LOC143032444 isoform X2 [Oratosquilla oratoria]